ncbi:MAG: hypothetical protein ABIO70_26175 [Pseudomonadota bacterium]
MAKASTARTAKPATALPSGHSVVVLVEGGREEVRILAPDGEVQVRIELGSDGPVVRLSGARLELEATREVTVRCASFEVAASGAVSLCSGAELSLRSAGEMHVDAGGEYFVTSPLIWLN